MQVLMLACALAAGAGDRLTLDAVSLINLANEVEAAAVTLHSATNSVRQIDAGADIVAVDPPRRSDGSRVALNVPCSDGTAFSDIRNEAFATSGATAQFVEIDGARYSHVMDPRTGLGLTSHRTVHVRAPDGATADAWATALGVLGPVRAQRVRVPADVTFCFVNSS